MLFRRALDRENVTEALSVASELDFVSLAEALELTLLLVEPLLCEPGSSWFSGNSHRAPDCESSYAPSSLACSGASPKVVGKGTTPRESPALVASRSS
jgi:hypothetical protein